MAEIYLSKTASVGTPSASSVSLYADNTANPMIKFVDDGGNVVTQLDDRNTVSGITNKTFVAPALGAATATTINGVTITGSGTLALGTKSLTMSNTLTFAGADGNTITFPSGSDTAVMLTGTQSVTGVKTLTNPTTAAGTTGVASMTLTHGTNLTNAVADTLENDAVAYYNTIDTTNGRRFVESAHFFRLAANGSAISGIADFFGTNDGIPTVLNGVYEIEWHCYFTVATGGTSTWTIVSTQTTTNMVASYLTTPIAGFATAGAMTAAGVKTQTAASVALPVSGSLSAADHYHIIRTTFEAATAGNIRLRQTMSAGTSTPLRDSYFKVRRLPAGNTGTYVA